MHMHPLYTEYHDKGFVLLPTLLPESCREELKEALQQAKDSDFFDETGFGFLGQNAFRKLPAFAHALEQHPIAEYASRLLQSEEVLLFQDLIIWKPPCSKRPNIPPRKVEWHQDYSYWPLSAPKGVTIWIALDESTKENGAIIYISQSHLWGECRATLYTEQESYSEENELPPLDIHNGEHIQQSCHAGMAIAHHPLCCHMSPFNESEQHRRAWSLTFITPDVVWDPEHAAHPINYQLSPSQKEVLDAPCFPRFHHSLEHRI